jgi:sugar phosphate isomerase/epimerase
MDKFILSGFADEIDMDLNIQMDVMDKCNIKHIEMRGVDGKGLVEHDKEKVNEIKKKLDDRNFRISAIGSPIGKIDITDPFEEHLDLFKYTIDIAHTLDAKYIRMFSFFIPKGQDPYIYRDEVINRWEMFVDAAKDSGLVLLHENEKDIYGDTPERCLDLLKTLDCPYVRATFDPANFVQCGVEVYPHAFNMLRPYIEYMHIKDALSRDGSVVPAGYGDGNIDKIIGELYKENDNPMYLSLEPHLGKFAGLVALEKDNNRIENLPSSGEEKFITAFNALKNILSEIVD